MTHIVYHGTQAQSVYSLMKEGFRLHHEMWGRGAGNGVYVSRSKSFANEWGNFIVVCELKDSIRLLRYDAYDPKVIASLTREFGAAIKKPDFWKILPHNKQFKRQELIELWRYYMTHYYLEQKNNTSYLFLAQNLSFLYKQLRYHQFDGFEVTIDRWPEMMIFNPDCIRPVSVHEKVYTTTYENQREYTDSHRSSFILSEALPMEKLKEIQERGLQELAPYIESQSEDALENEH